MSFKIPIDGRIEDFPVFRILAEIGTNRISGVLTLSSDHDTVDLHFDMGGCVFAESHYPRDGIRLGRLLILRGFCTETQISELLSKQEQMMLKLGRLARDAGFVNDTELMRILEDQILLNIFPSLTWTRGVFYFDQRTSIPYEKELIRPVDLKPIFRMGQKILKSWDWVRERISEDDIIPLRVPGIEVIPEGVKVEHSGDSLSPKVLNRIQEKVLEVIDDKKNVREVCDAVHLFEWSSRVALLDLEDAGIIKLEPGSRKKSKTIKEARDRFFPALQIRFQPILKPVGMVIAGLVILIVIGFLVQQVSYKNLLQPKKPIEPIYSLKASTHTLNRGDTIRTAMMVYYLFEDRFPDSLDVLAAKSLIKNEHLMDGWGSEFVYEIFNEKYELRSSGPDRIPSTEDDMVFPGKMSDHIFGCLYQGIPVSGANIADN